MCENQGFPEIPMTAGTKWTFSRSLLSEKPICCKVWSNPPPPERTHNEEKTAWRTKIAQSQSPSDFRVDGAKSPENSAERRGQNRFGLRDRSPSRSRAAFHRTLKSQCGIASLLSQRSLRFLGSAMGIAMANRKNRCDFGALRKTGLGLRN